jgi:hypothetical protein
MHSNTYHRIRHLPFIHKSDKIHEQRLIMEWQKKYHYQGKIGTLGKIRSNEKVEEEMKLTGEMKQILKACDEENDKEETNTKINHKKNR